MRQVEIFDLDGVICDDSHRRKYADLKEWGTYHGLCDKDEPMNLQLVENAWRSMHEVVFVTGRPLLYAKITRRWLSEHLPTNLPYKLLMRPLNNTSPSPELKCWLIKTVDILPDEVVKVWEDRADVLEAYEVFGITRERLNLIGARAKMNPAQVLHNMAETWAEKNTTYTSTYERFGDLCAALYPDGLTLKEPEDWVRFGLLIQCIHKVQRYAAVEGGHLDSAYDLAVYAAMLTSETDGED